MAGANVNLTDHIPEVLAELDRKKPIALETVGLAAEGYAKRLCPVDTGRLRNSITHTTSVEDEIIGTNVEYAPYVELGTVKTPAQPYLRPAVADHIDQYRKIIEKIMKE